MWDTIHNPTYLPARAESDGARDLRRDEGVPVAVPAHPRGEAVYVVRVCGMGWSVGRSRLVDRACLLQDKRRTLLAHQTGATVMGRRFPRVTSSVESSLRRKAGTASHKTCHG